MSTLPQEGVYRLVTAFFFFFFFRYCAGQRYIAALSHTDRYDSLLTLNDVDCKLTHVMCPSLDGGVLEKRIKMW